MKEIMIQVKGMSCGGCENRIQNALNTIKDVKKVEANHIKGTVHIMLKSEIEKTILEEKIEDIGFEVVKEN